MSKSNKISVNHIHRYKKVNLGNNGKDYFVYRCSKPLCSHYVPVSLADGKLNECNRCGEPFILTKIQLSGSGGRPMARPHCTDCIRRKRSADVEAIAEFLKGSQI